MPDLLRMMSTTREIRIATQRLVLQSFEELLRQYHLNADRFRGIMRSHGAVVGGYMAFQFFMRYKTGSCSLDVYTVEGDESR